MENDEEEETPEDEEEDEEELVLRAFILGFPILECFGERLGCLGLELLGLEVDPLGVVVVVDVVEVDEEVD